MSIGDFSVRRRRHTLKQHKRNALFGEIAVHSLSLWRLNFRVHSSLANLARFGAA